MCFKLDDWSRNDVYLLMWSSSCVLNVYTCVIFWWYEPQEVAAAFSCISFMISFWNTAVGWDIQVFQRLADHVCLFFYITTLILLQHFFVYMSSRVYLLWSHFQMAHLQEKSYLDLLLKIKLKRVLTVRIKLLTARL